MVAVEPVAQFGPELARLGEARVVLDQGGRHVDPEAGQPQVQPVRHDPAQRGAVGPGALGVDGLAPGLFRILAPVAEVECGLALEEVRPVPPGPAARGGDEAVHRPVGPDVAVVGRILGRGPEPGVLVGGVAGDQVQQDPDALAARRLDQCGEVVGRAVARGGCEVVGDVVTRVTEGRGEARVQPDRVHAQPGEVVEVLGDAREVADAVAVGVGEGLGVDLVQHGVGQPVGAGAGRGHGWDPPAGCRGATDSRRIPVAPTVRLGHSRTGAGLLEGAPAHAARPPEPLPLLRAPRSTPAVRGMPPRRASQHRPRCSPPLAPVTGARRPP